MKCWAMGMGKPLGQTFANIFMYFQEKKRLELCPNDFRPVFCKV